VANAMTSVKRVFLIMPMDVYFASQIII